MKPERERNYYEKLIVVEIGGRMQIKPIRVYGK